MVVDRELRVLAASTAAASLLGRRPSDLAGLELDEFLPGGVLDPEAKLSVRRPDGSGFQWRSR